MQDKNVLLLNTPDNNLKKKGSSTSSSGEDPDILDSLPADQWAALEAEAAQRAAAEAGERARAAGKDQDTIAERAAAAAARAVPQPKAQRNFTDPDSRIMKTADGSFAQCFNAQSVVDADHP